MVEISKLNYKVEIGTLQFDVQYSLENKLPFIKIVMYEDDFKEYTLETERTNLITMNFLKYDYSIESLVYFEKENKDDFSSLHLNFDFGFEFSGIKFELTKRHSSFFLSIINLKNKTLSTVFYYNTIDSLMEFVTKYNANLCATFIEYELTKVYDNKFGKGEFIWKVWKIQDSKFKIPIISNKVHSYLEKAEKYKKEYDLLCKKSLKARYLKTVFPDIDNKN